VESARYNGRSRACVQVQGLQERRVSRTEGDDEMAGITDAALTTNRGDNLSNNDLTVENRKRPEAENPENIDRHGPKVNTYRASFYNYVSSTL